MKRIHLYISGFSLGFLFKGPRDSHFKFLGVLQEKLRVPSENLAHHRETLMFIYFCSFRFFWSISINYFHGQALSLTLLSNLMAADMSFFSAFSFETVTVTASNFSFYTSYSQCSVNGEETFSTIKHKK